MKTNLVEKEKQLLTTGNWIFGRTINGNQQYKHFRQLHVILLFVWKRKKKGWELLSIRTEKKPSTKRSFNL